MIVVLAILHLEPPLTQAQLDAFICLYMLVACTNHRLKPWVCMHKTIGLNHGFVHTDLYICFLQNTKYEKERYII